MAAGISTRNRATVEKLYLFVEVESLCGATDYPLRTPRWKTPCLMHTLANQLRLSQKDTWAFYASVDGLSQPGHNQKLAHLISEIRVERSHLMFCTNCHKTDITTGYCCWVEIHPYKKKQ